jgi:hypothetical protein
MADKCRCSIPEVEEARQQVLIREKRGDHWGAKAAGTPLRFDGRCAWVYCERPMTMDLGQRQWHQRERRHLAMRQQRRGPFDP